MNGVQRVKDVGVTIASSLKFSEQCKEAAGNANRMMGFINRIFSFKNKDAILPLYIRLVRPYLKYAVSGRFTMQRIYQNYKLSSEGLQR